MSQESEVPAAASHCCSSQQSSAAGEGVPSPQSSCCPDLPAMVDAVRRGDMAQAQAALQRAVDTSTCSCLS